MKFFKNHTVAVILTVLVIVGCLAYGFWSGTQAPAPDLNADQYARSNYESYLGWISDKADLLSADTEKAIAMYNASLDHTYGSIVAVATVPDLGGKDIGQYAYDMGVEAEMGGGDMLLLLDKGTDSWFLQPGADIQNYVDNDLRLIFTSVMESGSVTSDANTMLPELFQQMSGWYEDAIPLKGDSSAGVAVGMFVLIVVLVFMVIFFAAMGVGRRGLGYGFWGPYWGPIFFPRRYPGGPVRPHHDHHDHHDRHGPFGPGGGFGGGGFGGGGFGGGGFGGGGRGGGFGGGGFGGGGFGGGGFGGGGRGGGFGG
jgi:hypothetical protein